MRSTDRAIAVALMLGGRDDLATPEIKELAQKLGCSTRAIYRYLNKIASAKFYLGQLR